MTIDLSGKPIAITGGGTGIGLATALECARAGMPVAIGGRRREPLERAAERVRAAGGRVLTMTLDVAHADQCAEFIARTVGEFGSIYSVFANAGYGLEAPFTEMDDAALRQIYEVNFFGTVNTIRPALEHMRAASPARGHVLICSSCVSKLGLPFFWAYSGTKAAQDHLGRGMRLELSGTGIHVSTVHPIGTRTEFFEKADERSRGSPLAERTPPALMQDPAVVARAIVRCLRRPRGEVWTSLGIRLAMGMTTALPGLADYVLRKRLEKRRRAR